jgi:hypothetical protein
VIEHNVFLDCVRAFSMQSSGHHRTTPGLFRFANNLIVFDAPKEQYGVGQPTFSFNGPTGDQHLDERQIVEVVSNTVVYNEELVNPVYFYSALNMGIQRLSTSTIVFANNIAGSLNASRQVEGAVFHLRSNNLIYQPGWDASYGQTDLQNPNSFASIYDFEGLRPLGFATYSASDGGAIGCRWDGGITIEDIRSMPEDWHERWPALEIPDAVGTSFAWFREDYR